MDDQGWNATRQRLMTRDIQALLGICAGLLADGQLNDVEIAYLRTWLSDNQVAMTSWPGSIIWARLDEILADGVVDEGERAQLVEVLRSITNTDFVESGSTAAEAPVSLPVDSSALIVHAGRSFCFTGKFLFGTREACQRAAEQAGASIEDSVVKSLDYLVIGAFCTPSWAYESYGRKIERALQWQGKGAGVKIVSEQRWVEALKGTGL